MRSIVVLAAILLASEAALLGNDIGARNRRIAESSGDNQKYYSSVQAGLLKTGFLEKNFHRSKRSVNENNSGGVQELTKEQLEKEFYDNEDDGNTLKEKRSGNFSQQTAENRSSSTPPSTVIDTIVTTQIAESSSQEASSEAASLPEEEPRSDKDGSKSADSKIVRTTIADRGAHLRNLSTSTPYENSGSSVNLVLDIFIGILCFCIILINIANIVVFAKNKGKCQGKKKQQNQKNAMNGPKSGLGVAKGVAKPSMIRAKGGADEPQRENSNDVHLPYCLTMNPMEYLRYGAAGHPNHPPVENADKMMEDMCRELTGDRKFYEDTTFDGEFDRSSVASSNEFNLDLCGFEEF